MLHPQTNYKDRLPQLTEQIVATYFASDSPHLLDRCPLPSHDAVTSVTEMLKEILYPGYRHRDRVHAGNVRHHVGMLIDRLHDLLANLLERAMCHQHNITDITTGGTNNTATKCQCEAHEKAIAFLETLPALRETLAKDVTAAIAGDPACRSGDEVIFCYPGFDAITIYRLAHQLHRLGVPLIPRMMTELAHSRTGIDIHPGATIGTHFFIDHGTGVVIGETCVIGDWVKLYQGVTLGALSFARDENGELVRDVNQQRHPTIEDRVTLYANATILGGKTVVGSGSVIGASAWVTKSVPPNSIVKKTDVN